MENAIYAQLDVASLDPSGLQVDSLRVHAVRGERWGGVFADQQPHTRDASLAVRNNVEGHNVLPFASMRACDGRLAGFRSRIRRARHEKPGMAGQNMTNAIRIA